MKIAIISPNRTHLHDMGKVLEAHSHAITLLDGGKIHSWLDLAPDDECVHLDRAHPPKNDDYIYTLEHAKTIFVVPLLPHKRLLEIWNSGKGKHPDYTPLRYFVEWAKMKGTIPEWMPVAIKLKLVQGETSDNDSRLPETAPSYPTTLIDIQDAAIAQFFSTGARVLSLCLPLLGVRRRVRPDRQRRRAG